MKSKSEHWQNNSALYTIVTALIVAQESALFFVLLTMKINDDYNSSNKSHGISIHLYI